MKNLILVSFIFIALVIPNVSQSNEIVFVQGQETEEEVDLSGPLGDTSDRSMQRTPIRATISSSYLDITIDSNLGVISIKVTSASGSIVYSTNVDSQLQSSLSIPVSSWDRETYQIRFENSTEKYLEGRFELQ